MTKARVITSIRPQLASRGTWEDKVGNPNWVAEEKFDGTRYLAAFTRSGIRIVSRRGIEKTDRLPKLVADLQAFCSYGRLGLGTILDGEVVARTFSETISLVNSLGSRGVDTTTPYRFMVFDILRWDRTWLEGDSFNVRRSVLNGLLEGYQPGIAQLTPQVDSTAIPTFLEQIWAAGGEGLILKDLNGRYIQGKRSRSWIKVKAVQTADGIILGFTDGEGKYSDTIGAMVIGQYRRGKLESVCKISGMTDELRYELGGNRSGYVGSVVELAYQNRTDESYRHPRFKRFRPDKAPEECIWEDS